MSEQKQAAMGELERLRLSNFDTPGWAIVKAAIMSLSRDVRDLLQWTHDHEAFHIQPERVERVQTETSRRLDAIESHPALSVPPLPPPSAKGEVVRAADGRWDVRTATHYLEFSGNWWERDAEVDTLGTFLTQADAIAAREKAPPPPGQGEPAQPAPPAPQPSEGATTPRPEVMAERMLHTMSKGSSGTVGVGIFAPDTRVGYMVYIRRPKEAEGFVKFGREFITAALTAQREAGAEEERKRAERVEPNASDGRKLWEKWRDLAEDNRDCAVREEKRADAALADRDLWKANHDEMVKRNALLRTRPDLTAEQLSDRLAIIAERDALAARVRELEKALDRATKATVEAIVEEVEAVLKRRAAIDFREWPAALAAAVRDGMWKGKPTPPKPLEVGVAYPASRATMDTLPVGTRVRYVDGGGHDYGICKRVEHENPLRRLETKDYGSLAGDAQGGTLTIVALPGGGGDNRK